MRKIQDAQLEGKKVILRVDFNVSLENGRAKETFKIKAAKESLDYLIDKKAKVALLSYFGRPEGQFNPDYSMEKLVNDIQEVLGVKVKFIPDCVGKKVLEGLSSLSNNDILLLENARFHIGEDKNDENLARQMAEGFDLFINDAFSQSHRNQASITGITKFLPSYAGFQLQKELVEMEKVRNNYMSPAVAIIGGAKIETKLPVIKFFEEKYQYVLVGGKIANEALDQKINFTQKVILPFDFIDERFDIGPITTDKFKQILNGAKTIVWNGPLGKFEEKKYEGGTYEILDAILASKKNNDSYVMIGGGETLEALEKRNAMDKVNFVSTGGGAMLEYLGGGKMPGIEVLRD